MCMWAAFIELNGLTNILKGCKVRRKTSLGNWPGNLKTENWVGYDKMHCIHVCNFQSIKEK